MGACVGVNVRKHVYYCNAVTFPLTRDLKGEHWGVGSSIAVVLRAEGDRAAARGEGSRPNGRGAAAAPLAPSPRRSAGHLGATGRASTTTGTLR